MNVTAILASSAVVAAVVGGLISFLTQRWLLERKAQVDYEFAARKRLYEAIGPLRLQLLFAARDVVGRVTKHSSRHWNMKPSEHYARSFIYRLLRPVAVGQMIERQIGVVDLSIDGSALELLRFNATVGRMLTGDHVVLNHPQVNWSTQSQHVFHDNLRSAAARLVVTSGGGALQVMDYAQFVREIPDPTAEAAIRPLALIFQKCEGSLLENPIFWLRVVGYAYACNGLIKVQGKGLGFEPAAFPLDKFLGVVRDEQIASKVALYAAAIESVGKESL